MRRIGKASSSQSAPEFEHGSVIWPPIRELPYGPATHDRSHQRPDRCQHPTARRASRKILVALTGESTDGKITLQSILTDTGIAASVACSATGKAHCRACARQYARPQEDFNRSCADPRLYLPTGEAIGHRVVVWFGLDVIVEPDPSSAPFGMDPRLAGKRFKSSNGPLALNERQKLFPRTDHGGVARAPARRDHRHVYES